MNAVFMTASAPRRSRWIPCVFVLGFAVVVGANAALIAFAIASFSGLTTTEPYTKGLRFNDEIRQAEVQERLGWHVATRFHPSAAQRGEMELKLTDRTGAPLHGARITALLTRPAEKDRDFTVAFESSDSGRYVARADFSALGVWDVKYRIERDGQTVEARERLEVE